MIKVQIVLQGEMLHSCKACGHAKFASFGKDIVCAAVTMLLRTTIDTLSKNDLFNLQIESSCRGKLFFSVGTKYASKEAQIILKYTADFLQNGLKKLSMEYPKCVSLEILAEA